jgi:hypothetical protein
LLYNKELAIFSGEPPQTKPGFPEVPDSLFLEIVGILILFAFVLAGCELLPIEESNIIGLITINNVDPVYNNQYAVFRSGVSTKPEGGECLIGFLNNTLFEGARIINGSVTMPVYLMNGYEDTNPQPYNGNDIGIKIHLSIKNTKLFTKFDIFDSGAFEKYMLYNIHFSNGNALFYIPQDRTGMTDDEEPLS